MISWNGFEVNGISLNTLLPQLPSLPAHNISTMESVRKQGRWDEGKKPQACSLPGIFFPPSTSIRKDDWRHQIQGHKEKQVWSLNMTKGSSMSSLSCRTSEQTEVLDHQHRVGHTSVNSFTPLQYFWCWGGTYDLTLVVQLQLLDDVWLCVLPRDNSGILETVP